MNISPLKLFMQKFVLPFIASQFLPYYEDLQVLQLLEQLAAQEHRLEQQIEEQELQHIQTVVEELVNHIQTVVEQIEDVVDEHVRRIHGSLVLID